MELRLLVSAGGGLACVGSNRSQPKASLLSNLLSCDFAEFHCSQCADLIGPGNEVAEGIINPSAWSLLLSVASLNVLFWIHIRMEPVWYGSSVSIFRGSRLSPLHPQPPPYLGPSHTLWAHLGRVYLMRTDPGVCGGLIRNKIGATGMESNMFCMRISGFQSVFGPSLDKQDVPHLVHIFKSVIFLFLGAWRPLRTQHYTILHLLYFI